MSKIKTVFICGQCGYESVKWAGKCPSCGEWNSFSEETISETKKKDTALKKICSNSVSLSEIDCNEDIRFITKIKEFDRVVGGGIVKGSLILVSGEPGIGKSTILLQICGTLNMNILYVSGEESASQIKLRAQRLGVKSSSVKILCETDVSSVCDKIIHESPDMVIIDSIQTMLHDDISSSPGSVSQVKECTAAFMHLAKTKNIPVFLIGHVNKEGAVAGPKVMEHMVDAVLYFEGDRSTDCRILRAIKNRYGSANEVGVFEMTGEGLKEVENPSLLFLRGKPSDVSGITTVCVMEGSRPLAAEVQALVSQTPFPAPRRVANGFDFSRLNLIIAVLEKRCGFFFGTFDAYINVVGGLKLNEPAADLAIAIALASGLKDFIIPQDTVIFGEVGLAGEVRAVSNIEKRIAEAEKLGFKRCVIPERNKTSHMKTNIELIPVMTVRDALNKL